MRYQNICDWHAYKESKCCYYCTSLSPQNNLSIYPPKTLNEDRIPSADVIMHIYNTINIRLQVISPWNHGSLRTERYTRSASEMLCKHLKTAAKDWHHYINSCCYALDTYVSLSTGY